MKRMKGKAAVKSFVPTMWWNNSRRSISLFALVSGTKSLQRRAAYFLATRSFLCNVVLVSAESIGQKYRPFWVSVSVSDLNQNSGFSLTLIGVYECIWGNVSLELILTHYVFPKESQPLATCCHSITNVVQKSCCPPVLSEILGITSRSNKQAKKKVNVCNCCHL